MKKIVLITVLSTSLTFGLLLLFSKNEFELSINEKVFTVSNFIFTDNKAIFRFKACENEGEKRRITLTYVNESFRLRMSFWMIPNSKQILFYDQSSTPENDPNLLSFYLFKNESYYAPLSSSPVKLQIDKLSDNELKCVFEGKLFKPSTISSDSIIIKGIVNSKFAFNCQD